MISPLSRRLALAVCGSLALVGRAVGQQQYDPRLYGGMHWRLVGPFRGGRTVAIAGVPDQPNVFYMAPNNGGVWKSTDAGRTWHPIFDGQPTGSIGALAVAPSDPSVIYVGSGEGLQRPDLSVGDGIYKSSDSGKTWTHLGLAGARQIGSIAVDPRDPNRVYVAALGHPYGPNPERGVYRSVDGGRTWEKVLYKDEDTGAIDIVLDPTNPQTIYADLWSARQGPWEYENAYLGPGSGLYKSTDGGTTWHQLSRGLPTTADGLGRIGVAVAPADPTRVYALVQASKGGGLYRSDDAGESWTQVNAQERIYGRGDDFAGIRVDPRSKDEVIVANTSTYRSTDAGKSFTAFKGAPGGDDYHTIWINPRNPDIIFLGSDQGATISVNRGRTWSSWYNQPTAQMFHVATDDRFPYWIYGGQQESGSVGIASRSDYGEITFRDWHPVGVEEYGYAAPDPLHPGIVYGGKVTRFDERTGEVQFVGPVPVRNGNHRFVRTAPILFSPVDPHILYFATEVLWKTTDGGNSWTAISPDLGQKNPGKPANLGHLADADTANHRGVIYAIAPSPKDGKRIWVGTDDGLMHVTRDGGAHWTNVTPPDVTPWSKVTQMDASHFDTATAYASVSRFRLDDLRPYIYRTRDGGKTWTKIVNGLPDGAPVNVVREDPKRRGLLYAGTELGVWVSFDDGDHWQSLQLDLPHTSVRDLVVHDDDIVVGTHGRSIWILDDVTPLRQLDANVAKADAFLFRPQLTYRVRRNENTDTPLPPEEPAGQNPPDGAVIDYWLARDAAGPVTVEIYDRANALVRRFTTSDTAEAIPDTAMVVPSYWVRPLRVPGAQAGMHRFVWDLRYPTPDALQHEYPISAIYHDTPRGPQGALALPGSYTVKLTVDGRSVTQPLTIRMDPRVTATPAALARQFTLARRITSLMHDDWSALQEVRAARAASGQLADSLRALESKRGPAGAEGLAPLNEQLATLLEIVDGADAAPTTQTEAALAGVERTLRARLSDWARLKAAISR